MQNPEQSENIENAKTQAAALPEPMPGDERETAEGDEAFVPRGAMVFALVLIAGYIIYYFLIWHEVVILRGGA